ncbi:MAG: S9 family peptidase [Candidatus Eisenbacteria sp.]|nr:S9 family peptidase [Candidatus Eisenbacteria bacterium]
MAASVLLFQPGCGQRQQQQAGPPDLIPREVLFGNPDKVSPKLSPDGKYMAYLKPVDDVLNVWIRTVGKQDDKVVTRDTDRGIRWYFWAYDNEHIVYGQDKAGDENWRLYAVHRSGEGEEKDLTPLEGIQARVVDLHPDHPGVILVALNDRNPQLHDVYKVDLKTGKRTLVEKNPGNFVGWMTDNDFNLRGALAITPTGGFDVMIRKTEKSSWKKFMGWGPEDSNTGPVGFTPDNKGLYLIDGRTANAAELVEIRFSDSKITRISGDPRYDVSNIASEPRTNKVQAVGFSKARLEWEVVDPAVKDDFAYLKTAHEGDFFVVNRDLADKNWLIAYITDDGPVYYYAYDRGRKKSTFMFTHRPELEGLPLAKMKPISFTARDGLRIEGYLTFPVGVEPRNLPMVLNVHGGPWHRDTWGYNPEAQWLANRGYASLQVNFRGSTGYGKEFVNAGDREWGGKMQDDLIDGVEWAVEQGYVDPGRVAIYGGSYGGYAALVGATFTPDVFCCAVDIVGPANLTTWLENVPPYWIPILPLVYHRVGNPEEDADFLMSRSPITRVDKIEIPMLIAQGANDPRVPMDESEQIVAAMEKNGIEYGYFLFEDEGHGFAKPENRLLFYGAAEEFLARYMGGRFEGEKMGVIGVRKHISDGEFVTAAE